MHHNGIRTVIFVAHYGRCNTPKMSQKMNTRHAWEHCMGKKLLEQDLRSGTIPINPKLMKPSVAFLLRPEFAFPNAEDGKRLFSGRLSRAREEIKYKNESS
jgi:hypothetical protein